jgi:hypothetical protein
VTGSAGKARRKGWIGLIAALVAVAAVWYVYTIQHRPRKPRTAAELVDELKTINPPEGAQRIGSIGPIHQDYYHLAISMYQTDASCEAIATHYKKEFARHGFVPKRRDDEKPEFEAMSFCGHETYGAFGCKSEASGQHFIVSLRWPDNPC